MPKSSLAEPDATLEVHLIETMLAGLKNWRPDLNYPQSYSDMEACARGLMRMFEIKRAPLPIPLKYFCDYCEGTGYRRLTFTRENGDVVEKEDCSFCNGVGFEKKY
jgi:hypothetical protein